MTASPRSLESLVADLRRWLASGRRTVLGKSVEQFAGDEEAFNSGNWCIVCVGKAAGRILKHHPGFASEDIRAELVLANAARNRIAHGYYDLDAEQVWKTLTEGFPKLAALLDASQRLDPE